MRRSVTAAFAALGATAVHGAVLQYCPENGNNICLSVAIPESTTQTNTGNIYFQIRAPATYQWVALGTGTGMAGSNMFILYQDGKGNVTISPRRGTFHTPPTLDTSSTAAQLTLLDGTGVSTDGKLMTANVVCANCESWAGGGTLQTTATDSSWISAWKQGQSLASTGRNARIAQHDDTAVFRLDLTMATLVEDVSPFTNAISQPNGGASDTGDGSGAAAAANGNKAQILAAHGIIMSLVMVVLYPLGAMLMPLVGKWVLHAAVQLLSFLLMWAGFALGVKAAQDRNMLFQQTHTLLGTCVTAFFVLQPILGIMHHRNYQVTERRGFASHLHIWYGRILMIMGIVNGGLGLQLAGAVDSLITAYAIVAGMMALLYAIVKVTVSMRSRHHGRARSYRHGHKESLSPPRNGHHHA